MDPIWQPVLRQLIAVTGAELVITEPDDTITFTAPLARTWRLDTDEPDCLWLRPLAPPVTGDDGTTVFALSRCRPRALTIATMQSDGPNTLALALTTGQRARIRPATGTPAETLDAWDTFVGARLDAAEELALDTLDEDVWTGRYAC